MTYYMIFMILVEIYRPLSPTMYSIGSRSSVGSYALAMSPTHQLAIPIMLDKESSPR